MLIQHSCVGVRPSVARSCVALVSVFFADLTLRHYDAPIGQTSD